jgi:hypothetical protein
MSHSHVSLHRSVIVLLATTIALAGCMPATPSATESPSSTPSASETPTPTPTPSATPTPEPSMATEDPADLGTWIIDGNGIGPIDIGTDIGPFAYLPGLTHTECALSEWTRADGLVISPVTGFEHDQIHGVNLTSSTAGVLPDSPHTAAGITVGSPQAEAEAAYPAVAVIDDGFRQPYLSAPLDGRFVIISFEGGLVSLISVSSFDKLPGDYC